MKEVFHFFDGPFLAPVAASISLRAAAGPSPAVLLAGPPAAADTPWRCGAMAFAWDFHGMLVRLNRFPTSN